jgi:hypothetical protein
MSMGGGAVLIRAPAFYSNGTDYLTRVNQGIRLVNSQKLQLGTTDGTDVDLYHDGTNCIIDVNTGDLSFVMPSGKDINIPEDIGLTFGDAAEKIEGDGTDLTISGNIINLSGSVDLGNNTLSNIGAAGNDWGANSLAISSSYSGNRNTINIENTNTAANSDAAVQIVTPASANAHVDPYIHLRISGTQSWSVGIDNDQSDRFVIGKSEGTFADSTDALRIDTSRNVSIVGGDLSLDNNSLLNVGAAGNDWGANALTINNANSGASVGMTITNGSDTAGSTAVITLVTEPTANAGVDPLIHWRISETLSWYMGVDNSSSDTLAFGPNGSVVGGQDALRATTANPSIITFDTTKGSDHDYVCTTCGEHSGEPFVCHGETAPWHDDVLALVPVLGAVSRGSDGWLTGNEAGIKHLAQMGVFDIGTHNDGSPRIGMNMVQAQWYSWASLAQSRRRMDAQYDEQEARMDQLEQRLLAVGG